MKHIINEIKKLEQEFLEIRHQIHQHPELGLEEEQTSKLVAQHLKKWGYEVDYGLAKTGVVGTLKLGNSPRTIGIRADMDALPIVEESGKAWQSKILGKFHGCGHDGHTAILLCAAKYLAQTKNFDGTIHLIFQPAEELLYGGKLMLEDGLFDKYPCDIIFALHNMPGFAEGHFCFKSGPLMASCDTLHIKVKGKGSHGAMPEQGVDATIVACYIATALQSIVSRNTSPHAPAVITIGSIQSGSAPNVVNSEALMKLSIRTLDPQTRTLILKRTKELATLQAESFGAKVEIEHINGSPVLINGEEATKFGSEIAKELFGEDKVIEETQPSMGSEDFSFMLESNPNGCYLIIGAGEGESVCNVHNPGYDFNDNCIVPAAAFWVALTERYLMK